MSITDSCPLTVGSLFAGIGAFDLGFERAGFQIRWQVEIDDYCQRVLAKHWPDVERFRDVRTCGRDTLAAIDVLCGGFPCQPHSQAGRRGGSADERDLWPEFARLIRELEPRWGVAESVRGLLSTEAGRFFGAILGDLAACGYDAEWDCVPAAAFGAPHRRDRVWLVAYPMRARGQQITVSASRNEATDERRAALHGHIAASRREAVADAAWNGLEEKRLLAKERRDFSDHARRVRLRESALADTESDRWATEGQWTAARFFDGCGELQQRWAAHWHTEPHVGRVADGIPARLDRLRGLGNAIVPQIAQWIADSILI